MVHGPIAHVGPGQDRTLFIVQALLGLFVGSTDEASEDFGKAWGDGAACLADEELVQHLLANRCMAAVAEHVCCSLMLPQFSHDTAADLHHAGSGPTAAEAAQSGAGPSNVPAVNTCSPAHQLPAARRAALAAKSCLGTRSEIEEQKVTLQDALH